MVQLVLFLLALPTILVITCVLGLSLMPQRWVIWIAFRMLHALNAHAIRQRMRRKHDALERTYVGKHVSFRSRCDDRSGSYRIVEVLPNALDEGFRLVMDAPEDVFHGRPILLFDAGMPWWEVYFRGEEDVTTVDVRFDWEDEWRRDTSPGIRQELPPAITRLAA